MQLAAFSARKHLFSRENRISEKKETAPLMLTC